MPRFPRSGAVSLYGAGSDALLDSRHHARVVSGVGRVVEPEANHLLRTHSLHQLVVVAATHITCCRRASAETPIDELLAEVFVELHLGLVSG